ncbi:uncharacterized protein F5891DRAFT_96980 [Suillus fuscotomentosus]|uniref:Secreted protein n=1 Tax=Suillus fuscotomentosus TaxID=1912939 RepID=A0AAD4EBP3_9AGAM|nr:uncharacterized protein F5891DRAFT_96980 [Suillus fuscotomentosus]KAG1903323.1 hypothetical protein F5891DRAFT_96980 [Suillus fuscotomentosus]
MWNHLCVCACKWLLAAGPRQAPVYSMCFMARSVGRCPTEPQDVMLVERMIICNFVRYVQWKFYGILWCFELIHFFPASGCGNLIALVEHRVAGRIVLHPQEGDHTRKYNEIIRGKVWGSRFETIRPLGALVVIRWCGMALVTGCRAAYQLS